MHYLKLHHLVDDKIHARCLLYTSIVPAIAVGNDMETEYLFPDSLGQIEILGAQLGQIQDKGQKNQSASGQKIVFNGSVHRQILLSVRFML